MRALGYTLIEVMVALFIFAIASVLISQGLVQSMGYRTIINEQTQSLIKLQKAMTVFQNDMIQATTKPIVTLGRIQGSFVTDGTTLKWIRRGYINPQWAQRKDSFLQVQYTLEGEQWLRILEGPDKPVQRQVLLEGVKAVEWRFYDEEARNYNLWPPVQNLQFEIPKVVTLTLELTSGEQYQQTLPLASYKVSYEKGE